MGEAVGAANGGAMVPRGLAVGEAVVPSNCADDSMQPQINVGHLSAPQVTIFRQWMACGYDVPVADAAAIKGMSVDHAANHLLPKDRHGDRPKLSFANLPDR